jgi:CubicO group peptidase (beta-lactamase class C family)
VGYVPGSKWQYSGDGFLIIQRLMTDATGESFPQLMRDIVFDKIGMRDTTYEEPLPSAYVSSATAKTLMSGEPVPGKWHVTPEMAAGGLWSTPTDLAKLAIEIALSERGKSDRLLSAKMTDQMLHAHWTKGVLNIFGTPQDPDAMGWGFFVGNGHRFGHIGGNVGYQATLVMFGDSGKGAVIMTNSDIGLHVGNELLDKIAQVYGWNYTAPPPP